MKKLNWSIWIGFLISIFVFFSYPTIFVRWASTRDFPWANFVIFGVALVFLVLGVRRAFQPDRRLLSKIVGSALGIFSALIFATLIFTVFIASRWLPHSTNAPQVGQTAPAFTLPGLEQQINVAL